jgi:crossover junction endodeoxyribonuclease RuvC
MIFVGIDPGQSGGIGVLYPNGPVAYKMPDTERDVYELLREIARPLDGAVVVVLEQVSAMPKQGVSSTFKFGKGYGFLRGCLMGLEVPLLDVRPAIWQKALGCLTRGNKNVSKAKAQQLYPQVKRITHATADALLLATYCSRQDWRGVVSRALETTAAAGMQAVDVLAAGAVVRLLALSQVG